MKKFGNMILALLMAFAVGLVSCSVDSGSGHNGPTGDVVVLSNDTKAALEDIHVGDEVEVKVLVNGTEVSLDDSILTVTGENVTVNGKKIIANVEGTGKLVITVNGKAHTFTFTIKPKEDKRVLKSISVSPDTLVLNVDGTVELPVTAYATFDNDGVEETESVPVNTYEIYSGSEFVQRAGNMITGIAAGTAKVRISYTFKNITASASVIITVNEKPNPDVTLTSISVTTSSVSVVAGKTVTLPSTVTATYSDNTTKSVTPQSYTSADSSIAVVNGYTLNGLKKGNTTVTISYTEAEVTKTCDITVNVTDAVLERITANDVSVNAGSEVTLPSYVKGIYSDGSEKEIAVDSYTVTEGSAYCSVSGKKVTGKAEGSAKIRVFAGGKTCVINVTVNPQPQAALVSISYNGTITVAAGKTVALPSTVVASYDDNTTKNVTPSYSSSSANIEVVDGSIKGKSEGSAVVTASYTEGSVTKTCEIEVTVTPAVVESIAFENTSELTVEVDSEISLPSTVKATYSNGNVSNLTPTYTSSDETIAKIVKTTKIKGVKEGSVNVTASYAGITAAGSIPVTVKAKPDNGSGSFIINFGNPEVKPKLTLTNEKNIVTLTSNVDVTSASVNLSSGSHSVKVTGFTNKVAYVDISSWKLEDKALITASGTINSYAVNASCEYNHYVDDQFDGVKIYVSSTSGAPTIWIWQPSGKSVSTKMGYNWGTCPKMKAAIDLKNNADWYVFEIKKEFFAEGETFSFILNKDNNTHTTTKTATFWFDAAGVCGTSGKYYDSDPTTVPEPVAPTLKIYPSTGSEIPVSSSIKVTANFGNDTVSVKTLTINGVSEELVEGENTFPVSKYATAAGETVTVSGRLTNSKGTATVSATYTTKVTKEDPFCWDNANVYFVIQDRFYDGDSSNNNSYGRMSVDELGKNIGTFHGGDIKGLTEKLDYVEGLGVNAIWITAPYEQAHGWCGGGSSGDFAHYGYHGYYPLDYTMMDKNMGTVEEFRNFVTECHKRGIRVVMDVVMNHTGYLTLQDCQDYSIDIFKGSYSGGKSTDMGFKIGADGSSYHAHHDKIDYSGHNSGWAKWWGSSWVRAGVPGYTAGGSDELTQNLSNLPDVKTDNRSAQKVAPILQTKWAKETTGYSDWIVPAASSLRSTSATNAPVVWIEKWLAAWVEEFGIDGFRCDTAKHVDYYRWGELKNLCKTALNTWRASNRADEYAKDWDEDFWMVGEAFNHTYSNNMYGSLYSNGFDALIDFTVASTSKMGTYSPTLPNWSDRTGKHNCMLYISSHDTGLGRWNDQKSLGTQFILTPGPIQIYYGDETSRVFGETGSDGDQGTRSDMNWSEANGSCAKHWGKVGRFRKYNPAVGAGSLNGDTRTYGDNKVVISTSSTTVSVPYSNGTTVYNWYDGKSAVVSGGSVTFSNSSASTSTPILCSDKNPADYGVTF